MLKMLQVRIQEHTSCRKKNSKHARFDWSKIRLDWSKIADKIFLQNFKSGSSPRKRL